VKGPALEEAMQKQSWDPSVKGLTSVPQVLAMMNDKLDWTSQLGEAFLAQPDDVQKAIQTLRAKAEATGNLKSSKEQRVRRIRETPNSDYVGPPEYIVIEPVEPDYIYVPVYDPVDVFGVGFWSPGYAPFFWYPPWWTVGPVFGFGAALFVGPALWYHYDWGHRGFAAIRVNTRRYHQFNKVNYRGGKNWKFDPAHHKAAFKNTKLRQQYGKIGSKGVQGTTIKGGRTEIKGAQTLKGTHTQKTRTNVESHKGYKKGTPKVHKGTHVQTHKATRRVQSHKGGHKVQSHKSGKAGARSSGKGRGKRR
jgi:Protein of unknown function (DUF3300)